MEILNLIKRRKSIRFYTDKPISQDNVKKLIEAARWAPNGHRIYSQRILIVEEKEFIGRIKAASPGLHGNPTTLMIICCDKKREKEVAQNYVPIGPEAEKFYEKKSKSFIKGRVELLSTMNGAIVAQNICLEATALGIGSCIIRGFDSDALLKVLRMPKNIVPQLYVALGYPDKSADVKFSRSTPQLPFMRSVKDMVIGWIK
jgi:nitroreductase